MKDIFIVLYIIGLLLGIAYIFQLYSVLLVTNKLKIKAHYHFFIPIIGWDIIKNVMTDYPITKYNRK